MRAPARGRGAGVRGAALPRWGAEPAPPPTDYPAPPDPQPPLYVYDEHINQRFAIWQGDITCLEVDALTNTTDESLSECNAVSERVMTGAGPELKEEIVTRGLECRPGEAVVTSGCRLRCRHVVHTACPAYSAQYHSAAETSLHNCYKNVLYAAADLNARTLALCPVDPPRRGFPPDLAAHTALRTIRCYLEQNPSPALVIMATNCGATCALLRALAPLYFPRSEGEARGGGGGGRGPRAPAPAPGPGGAGERRIRIIHNPHERAHQREDSAEDDTSLWSESAAVEAAALFARAADTQRLLPQPRDRDRDRDHAHPRHHPRRLRDDHDHQAIPKEVNECIDSELTMAMDTMAVELPDLSTLAPPAHQEETAEEKYERLLRRAKAEDLSEVSGIGCLYQSGVDRLGRPVVVFIGKWFPIGEIDLDKALLYLIKLLDPIVRGDYVIAYFHTLAASGNHPPFSWLKEVYTVLPYKYKKNLKAFYIVHPTFWTKMMTWWFTTFMAPAIKAKVHSLPGVEFLYSVLARDQLELPAFVTEYDMTINGLHYFQPDTSSS